MLLMSMSARLSRRFPAWPLWRLVLVLLLAPALVTAPALTADTVALAQDDDEADDEDEDEDEGGGEGEGEGEEEEDDFEDEGEEEEEEGEPQPPVTAGGMFTKKTYPVAELERPLTVIGGMLEVRGGIDIDVSDQTAFELFRLKLDGRYGLADHIELQAIVDFLIGGDRALLLPPPPAPDAEDPDAPTGVISPVGVFGAGIEAALYYDVVHFRSIAALTILPKADNAEESDIGFDLILGVPFRYRIKPQIAIVALDEIMTIHFAGGKPDLTVGVGGVFQVIPQVALTARAELFVPAFNTKLLTVPLTAAAQFSPNNKFDIGLEFTLPVDVRNEETRFDKRSALLFVQTRL